MVIIPSFIQDNIDRENLVAGTLSDRQCKMTLRNAFVSPTTVVFKKAATLIQFSLKATEWPYPRL